MIYEHDDDDAIILPSTSSDSDTIMNRGGVNNSMPNITEICKILMETQK